MDAEASPESERGRARTPLRTVVALTCIAAVVGVALLGFLAALVVSNLLSRFTPSQVKKAEMDIPALASAVDTYAIENGGRYPPDLKTLVTPDSHGRTYLKGYKAVPLDPWKNPYVYVPPTAGHDYRVICYGRDGVPGGTGEDAEIDNLSIRLR